VNDALAPDDYAAQQANLAVQKAMAPQPNDPNELAAQTAAGVLQAPRMQAQAVSVANAHSGITAQTAGQSAQTARQLGVPQAAVETDPATYASQALAQKNAAVVGANPVLAKWVAANPDSARIAQDEYDKLGAIEKMWDQGKDAGYALVQQLGHSFASASLGLNRALAPIANAVGGGQWWAKNFLQTQEDLETSLRQAPDAPILQKATGTAGSLLGLLSQVALTGGGGAAPEAAAGVADTLANAATHAGKSMAFPSLTASANAAHDTYEQTGDASAAARAAIGSYAFSTLQGAVPFSAPGTLASRALSGAAAGLATSEGQRAAMNLLVPSTARPFDPQEAIFQALTGAVLGGAMGPRPDLNLHEAVRKTYDDAVKAGLAERDIGRVVALSKIAQESALREHDPDAFHEFVRTVTDKSDLDAVYVDGVKLSEAFAQSAIKPTPELAQEMSEALKTGGDVRIPIADYATHIAGTDLEKAILPDMKASPDGMTMKEGQQFFQKAAADMKAKAAEMMQSAQERADLETDKQGVFQSIHEQMVAAGRDPGIARTEAQLATEFYSSMAAREGMKPSEFLKQNPINFEGDTAREQARLGQVFAQRESDVGHKRIGEAGRYVGAPDFVGSSPQKLTVLRKNLQKLTTEGAVGRYWYERSARAVLNFVGGDKGDAEKFIGLLAVYSQGTSVPANTTSAVKAWYQWKNGEPITAGRFPAAMGKKAEAWLNRGEDWGGIKTNNFYTDLMEEIDPSKLDSHHSTMDMWMALAGDYGAKVLDQGPKYTFMQREIARIADQIGWRPHQVQAAIWTAIKARVEGSEKARNAFEDAQGIRIASAEGGHEIAKGREYEHYRAATRFGLESPITQDEINSSNYDFGHALAERTAQISWEATPGATTGVLPGIHNAPMHQVLEYLGAIRQALSDEKGRDLIDQRLGLLTTKGEALYSGWQGKTTAGVQQGAGVTVTDGAVAGQSRVRVNLAADIRGLVLSQEAVAWHFPIFGGAKFGQNGVEFNLGRTLAEGETRGLYEALTRELGHSESPPIPTKEGFRVLNFPDEKFALQSETDKGKIKELQKGAREKNEAFHAAVERAVAAQDFGHEITDRTHFESDGELRPNDWSKGDSDYRGRIAEADSSVAQSKSGGSERSDLLGWVDDELRPRVQAVNDDFAARYGWDQPGPAGLDQSFHQGERGAFDPATRTVSILKGADLSTVVHELGHGFLDTLSRVAVGEKASEGAKADFKTILDWFGVKDEATWHAMSLDEQRQYHEKFAQSFERYLFEGKAPTQALQPLFSRVRSWMLSVYSKLSNLGVGHIDPEVKAVFDRMLASDEAIKQAEAIRSYAPLFTDAKAFGGDEARLSAYLKMGQEATGEAVDSMQARSLRDMKWLSNAKNKAIRAMQKEALAARKEVQAEVTAEVNQRPEYAAKDYLRANKGSDKEIVAGMHGYGSAEEMQQAIDSAPNRKDVVREQTDQKMLQRHGELTDPGAVELAANEAVHNEARARFMATGLKILTDSPLPANQIAKAAKEAAEATVAKKAVGDLRSDRYLAAEAKANKEAIKQAPKSPEKAVDAQRAAILNNRLAKAAMDAQAEVQKGLDYLKKFDKPTIAKAVGSEYMDRINELLSGFDITNRFSTGSDVAQRQQMRDWLQSEYQRTGVMPEVSDALMDFTNQRHWKELSVEEFRGLVDAVKSLEHVGREQQLVTVNGQRVALQDQVDRAKADMADMPHSVPVDIQPHLLHAEGLSRLSAQWLNLKSKLRGMDAALLKMEQLFQWLTYGRKAGLGETRTGPFLEMMTRAGSAEGRERAMRAESAKAMKDLGESLRDAKVNINESLDLPGLSRQGRGTQWYREELLSAALNMGNKEGLKNLVEGNGLNERALRQALKDHLSPAEWKFVQGTLDHINSYWPQIEALQKRMVGVAPPKVEALPIGDIEGGYFPIVRDAFTDRNIDEHHAKDAASLFENQFSKPVTNKGHTVARTGYVGPLHLSLGNIARHIDQVTHDLAWREAIVDMNKFLSHPEIQSEVDQVMGREYRKQFRPWLQSMANDKVFNTSGDTAWERFYRTARTNATLVGLGFRLSTMLIHGSSALSTSIGEVGTKWFAKGAAEFATPERWASAKQFMFDRSPEMANRFNESDRNIHEAIDQINEHQRSLGPISGTQKVFDGARKFAFYGVQALDMGSAAPTWMASYLKGMAPESKGGHGLSEEAAVELANRAVRNAHGGGGVKDLSAVQRDKGVMSMATMFYSFWNHMYNRQRDLGKGYANLPDSFRQGTGVKDFSKLLARSWWYFVVPQVLHAALKPSPQDQEDSLEANLKHFAEEIGLGFVSGVPVLRDLANAAVNGRDYTITPLEQAGKAIVKAGTDLYKVSTGEEPSKHAGKNAAQAVGYAAGLPTGQLSQTGTFLWDVYSGDADPQGIKDWYEGIQNGRLSQ
jgi:hypothetical protein